MVTLTDLELAGLLCLAAGVAFMLGHAAGYARARDAERRRRARHIHPAGRGRVGSAG